MMSCASGVKRPRVSQDVTSHLALRRLSLHLNDVIDYHRDTALHTAVELESC